MQNREDYTQVIIKLGRLVLLCVYWPEHIVSELQSACLAKQSCPVFTIYLFFYCLPFNPNEFFDSYSHINILYLGKWKNDNTCLKLLSYFSLSTVYLKKQNLLNQVEWHNKFYLSHNTVV